MQIEKAQGSITITGKLTPGAYTLRGDVSSQFISGLLFALPLLEGDNTIQIEGPLESASYIDLTVDTLALFSITVRCKKETSGIVYYIEGNQHYTPAPIRIESDWSQAAFFLCAAALGQNVAVAGLSDTSRQGDRAVLEVLRAMGCEVQCAAGVFRVQPPPQGPRGTVIDAKDIPDLVPPLAALACVSQGETRIVNAGRLRLKESDRLRALAEMLGGLGADIQETADGLCIQGKSELQGGTADAHGDHRIAMAAAVASIKCSASVALSGWECVSKSYPAFWQDWGITKQ
jgi:3-phosphoshikimate 1-carboxyvinyltransferase